MGSGWLPPAWAAVRHRECISSRNLGDPSAHRCAIPSKRQTSPNRAAPGAAMADRRRRRRGGDELGDPAELVRARDAGQLLR
eukprot:gene15332-biopygen231